MSSEPKDPIALVRTEGSRDLLAGKGRRVGGSALADMMYENFGEAEEIKKSLTPLNLEEIKKQEEAEKTARQEARAMIVSNRALTEYHYAVQANLNSLVASAAVINGGVVSLESGSAAGGLEAAATVAGIVPVVGQFIDLFLSGAGAIAGSRHEAAVKEKFKTFQENILPTLNPTKWSAFVEDLATVMTIANQEQIIEVASKKPEEQTGIIASILKRFKSSDKPMPAYKYPEVVALATNDSAQLTTEMFSKELADKVAFGGVENPAADMPAIIATLAPDQMRNFQINLQERLDSLRSPSPSPRPVSIFQSFAPQEVLAH